MNNINAKRVVNFYPVLLCNEFEDAFMEGWFHRANDKPYADTDFGNPFPEGGEWNLSDVVKLDEPHVSGWILGYWNADAVGRDSVEFDARVNHVDLSRILCKQFAEIWWAFYILNRR